MSDLFETLQQVYGVHPDRSGNCHIVCPACGKPPKRGQTHCSFYRKRNGDEGWKCFICDAGGTYHNLLDKINYQGVIEYKKQHSKKPKPVKPPEWLDDPETLVQQYESEPMNFVLWNDYKPLSAETIKAHRLGVGRLPASKCRHERLIVPLINGSIVGLRGRSIDCSCGKWLPAAGTPIEKMPLYNGEAVKPGSTVWICENPIDALMVGEKTKYTGVATYAVTYWSDHWFIPLRRAKQIIVAYDNDCPGNGGAWRRKEFIEMWNEEHETPPPEVPNGVKLVNRLLKVGLNAMLYDWKDAPYKSDIGTLLK